MQMEQYFSEEVVRLFQCLLSFLRQGVYSLEIGSMTVSTHYMTCQELTLGKMAFLNTVGANLSQETL